MCPPPLVRKVSVGHKKLKTMPVESVLSMEDEHSLTQLKSLMHKIMTLTYDHVHVYNVCWIIQYRLTMVNCSWILYENDVQIWKFLDDMNIQLVHLCFYLNEGAFPAYILMVQSIWCWFNRWMLLWKSNQSFSLIKKYK